MSATAVEPATRQTPRQAPRLFHFACSLIRSYAARIGAPVRCLCGAVQGPSPATRPPGSPPPPGERCVVCDDLAPAHLAVCSTCRRAVSR